MQQFKNFLKKKKLFPVVPILRYSKTPCIQWNKEEYRMKDIHSLIDFNKYYSYINKNGEKKGAKVTGYALITGKESNVMVIDLDRGHEDNIDGIKSFENFIASLDLNDNELKQVYNTLTIKTPSGGQHLYFTYRKGLKNKAKYIDGVDIRTDGGIIVLPWTKRRDTNKNSSNTIKEYVIDIDAPIQELPSKVFNKLIELSNKDKKEESKPRKQRGSVTSDKYKLGSRNESLFKDLMRVIESSRIRDIQTITTLARGLNKVKCNPCLEDNEVEVVANSVLNRLNPSYCNPKGNIILGRLVDYIINERPTYTRGHSVFMYNKEKGVYELIEDRELMKVYYKYVVNIADKVPSKSENFVKSIKIETYEKNALFNEKKYINCLNGVYDFERDKLMEHDPKFKTYNQLQANYTTKSMKERYKDSKFKTLIEGIFPKGTLEVIQESFGLVVSPHAKEVQKAFLWIGDGSNGKSTVAEVLISLYGGEGSISTLGMNDYGNKFDLSMLEGKNFNINVDDEMERLIKTGNLKKSIAGDPLPIERKGKDKLAVASNITNIFAINKLPSTADKSKGFFRRQCIIPLPVTFGTQEEVKRGQADKVKNPSIAPYIIKNELDIVLWWSIEGLKRLKRNNWSLTESSESIEALEEYKEDVDTVYSYYKYKLNHTRSENDKVRSNELYGNYEVHCLELNATPQNATNFGIQLKQQGIKKRRDSKGIYYIGIKIKK